MAAMRSLSSWIYDGQLRLRWVSPIIFALSLSLGSFGPNICTANIANIGSKLVGLHFTQWRISHEADKTNMWYGRKAIHNGWAFDLDPFDILSIDFDKIICTSYGSGKLMKSRSCAIILVSLIIPVGVRGQGKTTASLTETLDFIKGQLERVLLASRYRVQGLDSEGHNLLRFGFEEYRSFADSNVSYSGCELTFTETDITHWNNVNADGWGRDWRGSSTTVWGIKLPLGKMSVTGIKVTEWDPHEQHRAEVKLQTAGNPVTMTTQSEGQKFAMLFLPMISGQKMEWTKSVDGKTESHLASAEQAYLADVELAGRLAKAFAHAITLCGAKDDPFWLPKASELGQTAGTYF
jgi:hypothetical protein